MNSSSSTVSAHYRPSSQVSITSDGPTCAVAGMANARTPITTSQSGVFTGETPGDRSYHNAVSGSLPPFHEPDTIKLFITEHDHERHRRERNRHRQPACARRPTDLRVG